MLFILIQATILKSMHMYMQHADKT